MEPKDSRRLSAEEKRRQLYDSQVDMLKSFLAHHAITREEFEKSYRGLSEKMGYKVE